MFFFWKEKTRIKGIRRWDFSLHSPGHLLGTWTVHHWCNETPQNPECGWLEVGEEESSAPSVVQCVFIRGWIQVALSCRKGDMSAWQACFCIDTNESLGSHSLLSESVFWGWVYVSSLTDSWVNPFKPCRQCLNVFWNAPVLPCKSLVTWNSLSPKLTCPRVV